MHAFTVECLRCGTARKAEWKASSAHLEPGDCPRCGYVGWAETSDLSEPARRALRDRPVERRRLHALA
jgi:hypothetical protein